MVQRIIMKKYKELYEKVEKLPTEKFLRFLLFWHGEQFLWDGFNDSIESVLTNEGEKTAIEFLEDALEGL